MPFAATWRDLEIIILSQTEKDKYDMVSLICGVWGYPGGSDSKEFACNVGDPA